MHLDFVGWPEISRNWLLETIMKDSHHFEVSPQLFYRFVPCSGAFFVADLYVSLLHVQICY
jgi:hypothetical protein